MEDLNIPLTLNSPITVGQSTLLESMLILIVRFNMGHITFEPMLNLVVKV